MVNDTVAKEQTNEDKKSKKKKIPKEISQEILKKIFGSILRAVGVMLYFIVLNLAYSSMKQERLIADIKVFAGAFLVIGIIFLERAYKKDSGSIAISGIEFLVLSLHSLSIMHVITLFKYKFEFYLLTSSYVISIYYVLKAIILYTKGRREYLNSLSDISEIVKKDEPLKKEAKKANYNKEKQPEAKIEEKNKIKVENKPKKKKTASKKDMTKTAKSKNKNVKEEKVEETPNREKKSKSKKSKEENTEKSKKEKKKTTKVKSEEVKTIEKKKRGRPKKEEVSKND